MDKRETVSNFLKNFTISLNNAGVYFTNHPFFVNSIKLLKSSLDEHFASADSLTIGIKPNSLIIEGEVFEKEKTYLLIAKSFHQRKVKKIKILKQITVDELIGFLEVVAMPLRDVIKGGGVLELLKTKKIEDILIDELDYSELLSSGDGAQDKDVWKFLIDEVASSPEKSKDLSGLANNFDKVIKKFNQDDLKQDPKLMNKLKDIMLFLKKTDPEKFKFCSKPFLKFLIKEKDSLGDDNLLQRAKEFVKEVDADALSDVLKEEGFERKKVDPLALQLFSKLLDSDKQKQVSQRLALKLKDSEYLLNNPMAKEKISELFSVNDSFEISPFYREALSGLIQNIGEGGVKSFDNDQLYENYLYLLINLLDQEKKEHEINLIIEKISLENEKIIEAKNIEFIKNYLSVLSNKSKQAYAKETSNLLKEKIRDVVAGVEEILLTNIDLFNEDEFEQIYDFIGKSSLSYNDYVEKILSSREYRYRYLKMFLHFFPHHINILFNSMKENLKTVSGTQNSIDIARHIDLPESVKFLKYVFGQANPFLRIEVLKAMQGLSTIDSSFLLSLVKDDSSLIRKAALTCLTRASLEVQQVAANEFLNVFNLFGLGRKVLIKNIYILREEKFKGAKPVLLSLNKKFFFWWEKDLKALIEKTLLEFNEVKDA